MLRHESGDMDFAGDPEIIQMLRNESYTWVLQTILKYESKDTDLVEDPEMQRC